MESSDLGTHQGPTSTEHKYSGSTGVLGDSSIEVLVPRFYYIVLYSIIYIDFIIGQFANIIK